MAEAYEAVEDRRVRKLRSRPLLKNEDELLTERKRRILKTSIEDQRRNETLVPWMIRLHQTYAVDMEFQATTDDQGLNRELEAFVREQSHAHNFEVRGLVNARQGFRLLEGAALVGGDGFFLKVDEGPGLVQGLEADRVGSPTRGSIPKRYLGMKMSHGVVRSERGAARYYCIVKRQGGNLVYDQMARRGDVIEHLFFDRWDQGRGVSPLAPAVASVQDYHEARIYAALKSKLSHILGFAVMRDAGDGEEGFLERRTTAGETGGTDAATTTTTDEEPAVRTEYELKVGRGGPEILDMDPGDKVEPIESKHPSFEYQAFTDIEVRAIMLALDLPWTFFDARKGSYTIQRADKNRYMRMVVPHRERNAQTRNRWLVWKLDRGIYGSKEISLPEGWTIKDVTWEWRPGGDAWLDALKEVMASTVAIRMGLTSPQRICLERGVNWYQVREECREAFHWMVENGLPVSEWSGPFDQELAKQLLTEPEPTGDTA